jgi:tRNA A58 N-methylase Trm61
MQFSSRLRQRTDALCRALVKRKRFHTVMAVHSRLKDGVACALYVPAIHALPRGTKNAEASGMTTSGFAAFQARKIAPRTELA